VTYRVELSGRALKQMQGLPGRAFDSLIEAMADVADYPDDPLRTFPTGDLYVRRAEFGEAGLVTYKRWHQQSHHPRHHLGRLAAAVPTTCKSVR
jgi:hypothetical protein